MSARAASAASSRDMSLENLSQSKASGDVGVGTGDARVTEIKTSCLFASVFNVVTSISVAGFVIAVSSADEIGSPPNVLLVGMGTHSIFIRSALE